MNFGLPELIIVLIIVLLLFGSTRLPELSRSIGQSIKELREGFTSSSRPPVNDSKIQNTQTDQNLNGQKYAAKRGRGRPRKI